MFLFEKSLLGSYWIRSYDLGERYSPFHTMAELKQTAANKT